MMAPPDKDGIARQCAVPRTQGKDNQFWTGFPLRSFFMRDVEKYMSTNISVTGYRRIQKGWIKICTIS